MSMHCVYSWACAWEYVRTYASECVHIKTPLNRGTAALPLVSGGLLYMITCLGVNMSVALAHLRVCAYVSARMSRCVGVWVTCDVYNYECESACIVCIHEYVLESTSICKWVCACVYYHLLRSEHVQIVLASGFIQSPCGWRHRTCPISWRRTICLWRFPNVVIPIWIIFRFARFAEPHILIWWMIQDLQFPD